MAKTPFNHSVRPGFPFTVPNGRYAVFSAFSGGGNATATIIIGGVGVATIGSSAGIPRSAGPLTAKAGDAITASEGSAYGISGFLYDEGT